MLALVSRRYLENRDFNAVPYYRLELSVLKDGKELVFTCPEKYTQQQEAVAARNRIAASRVATVIQAERKETVRNRRFCMTWPPCRRRRTSGWG